MKILFIAPIPLHKDASAGAETINYYIKEFNKNNEITVISRDECVNSDDIYKQITIGFEDKIGQKLQRIEKGIGWIIRPGDKYSYKSSRKTRERIFHILRALKGGGYIPDVVILETTTAILWYGDLQNIFPETVLVASLHDIAYQGSERRLLMENSILKRKIRHRYLNHAKKNEIRALENVDLVVPHNKGNEIILFNETRLNKSNVQSISPYYTIEYTHQDDVENNDVIFFGLMSRPENYLSAEWFIERVFPKLSSEYRFVVIGGNPPQSLRKHASSRIIITGFLESDEVKKYFEKSFCLVCPLLLGSGIKTKLLTAMASGIPMLTNDIGIEGINAQSGVHYLHCSSADEYVNSINLLKKDKKMYLSLAQNSRRLIHNEYNLSNSALDYERAIVESYKRKNNDY